MIIKFDTGDFERLGRNFGSAKVSATLDGSIRKSIFILERLAKIETPVDTGTLRNSYDSSFSPLEGRLRNYREYAPYVHDGHRQTPGRFVGAIGRRLVASEVKGNPWMDRTTEKSVGKIQKVFDDDIDELLRSITQ